MKKLLLISSLFITSLIVAQPCVVITGYTVTPPTCFGLSNASIVVSYSPGIAPYNIQLSGPTTQSYVTSALTQSFTGLAPGSYNILISDNNGCPTIQSVNVSQPTPVILMTTPNTTICYGQSTQIAAFGQGGTPAYSYTWTPSFLGGGPHTVSPTVTTHYTVSLSDANGCAPSSKIITVNVTPPLQVIPSSISICDGASGTLVPAIVSQGNGGPYSYAWNTSETTSSINIIGNAPSGPTTTTYTLTVDDACTIPGATAIFTVNASVCTGIDDVNYLNETVGLGPNPAHESITITSIFDIHKIELLNIAGQVLLSESVNSKAHQLNLQNLTEGIYFVKITSSNGLSKTKKIVVSN